MTAAPAQREAPAGSANHVAAQSDGPVDLYIAAYTDPDAAQEDWDELKRLAKEEISRVDALVLVRRDAEGKAVEASLPPNSSGIVALFEEKWTADMEKLRARAEKITKHEVDAQSRGRQGERERRGCEFRHAERELEHGERHCEHRDRERGNAEWELRHQ